MAALNGTIYYTDKTRPCIADGKNALFHRWSDRAEVIAPSPLLGGHNGGEIKWTVAIVEFEDGTVADVLPRDIRFLDHAHRDYNFTEREDAKK